jgi:hypothetical protein
MGIIEDYLKSDVAPTASAPAEAKGSSLIQQYLEDTTSPARSGAPAMAPKPPISGVTSDQSDILNVRPETVGKANPRRYSSPSNIAGDLTSAAYELPVDIFNAIRENAAGGVGTVRQGAEDFMKGRPASAVGNIGLGALQTLISPATGAVQETVTKPLSNITGNRQVGEIVGGALPVSKIISTARAAMPSKKALSNFVDAIGMENLPTVIKELKSNPRLSPMDVSTGVQQVTQKLAVTPGGHQNYLADVVKQRTGSAKGAVGEALDTTMGAPVDVLEKLTSMKDAARKVGQQHIAPSIIGAKPVDPTPVIAHIDNILTPGVNSVISKGTNLPTTEIKQQLAEVRKLLTDGKSLRTDADTLHDFQSALRKEADTLMSSPDGAAKRTGAMLMEVRGKLVDAIDAASPKVNGAGTYKPSLAKYADEMQIDNAFDKGTEILRNRSTKYDDRPEFWAAWKKQAKPAEIEAAKEGASVAVDNQIRGMRNAVGQKGTEIPQVEFNKDKLSILFGDKEIEAMSKKLQHERQIADTNKKLFEGSQTGARMTNDARVAQRTDKDIFSGGGWIAPAVGEGLSLASGSGLPGLVTGTMVAANYGKRHLVNPVLNKLADKQNLEFSRLASATGPDREELIKKLSDLVAPVPKLSVMQKAKSVLKP